MPSFASLLRRCLLPWWLSLPLAAGTLVGHIVLPMTSHPLAGATLTLTLSQAAVVPGSYILAPKSVACYTTTDGSLVGLPDPTVLVSAQAQPGVGSLPAGLYFIQWTWLSPSGESLPSPELQLELTSPGKLEFQPPANPPFSANGYAIYIGAAAGAETRQYSGALIAYTQSSPLAAGAAPPAQNASLCTLNFNDDTVPAPTYYLVNLTDADGNEIAGFPQSWYLSGAVLDVSQIVPLSSSPALLFPMPILSNPSSSMPQSVNSPLLLNGYPLSGSSNVGPGLLTLALPGTLPAPVTVLDQWTPNVAIALTRISLFASLPGSGGTNGVSLAITDGVNTCTFAALLPAAQVFSSSGTPAGVCNFSSGLPLTLQLAADDHATRPANLNLTLEMTSH